MTLSSAAVTVISRPSGAAPCETQGNSSTPLRHTPTAPSSQTRSSANSAAPPSGDARAGQPPEHRDAGSGVGDAVEHGVGRE